MNIVLLGPPGSGKGTHARRLNAKYGLTVIGVGELVREEVRKATSLGKQIESDVNAGRLVDDELIAKMVQKKIESIRNGNGIVFDGYPRDMDQAEFIDNYLEQNNAKIDVVFDIQVPEKIAVERLSGRWLCPKCKFIYHVKYIPPKTSGICDKCNAGLVQREDDKPDVIKERFKEYHNSTEPVISHYKKKNILTAINGTGTPEDVFKEIAEIVDSMQK